MKRIAIPIVNNKLSENFGECNYYTIFEVGKKINSTKTTLLPDGIDAENLPHWLKGEGITDVITYKINKQIVNLFVAEKINLFLGIPIETPEKIIDDYLQGKLTSDKRIIAELTQ
ncbi:MAG TPA: NifB/NifX family molybdenum-iron cluster-binding protein [Draconibacterium sp.]|nr:NifB/NifX family molybdenum-iron cluster-binding protein [Draconibacterium sp.]